jgi:hypothetical protein
VGDSGKQKEIRVWRSLVSRLNGVQEALSSNLNTRTITNGNDASGESQAHQPFPGLKRLGFFLDRGLSLERKGWK